MAASGSLELPNSGVKDLWLYQFAYEAINIFPRLQKFLGIGLTYKALQSSALPQVSYNATRKGVKNEI